MESCEKFPKIVSSVFKTEDHKPRNYDVVVSDFDNRRIIISAFNFISKATSLLCNDDLMCQDDLIEGCDIMTGKINGRDFWA